jgi:H+-translocating NAD(P) transhydrogenase subunit alpha
MVDLVLLGVVFAVSIALGYLLISKVPARLHTPLMSMTNAISAITLLAGLLLLAQPGSAVQRVIVAVALCMATFNVVGGFAITNRMLRFFKRS